MIKKIVIICLFVCSGSLISQNRITNFVYLPDFRFEEYQNLINYKLITHLAVFPFTVNIKGEITNPYNLSKWTNVKNQCKSNGVKYIMSVVTVDTNVIKTLCDDQTARDKFKLQVQSLIQQENFDGLNIDFESVTNPVVWNKLVVFVKEISDMLHSKYSQSFEVSFAGLAINWHNLDLESMANSCDYIFIMAYDFYGEWSTNTGPVSPLIGPYQSLTTILKGSTSLLNYKNIVSKNPEKLILGLPLYGQHWKTETNLKGSKVKEYVKPPVYYQHSDSLIKKYNAEVIRDTEYGVPWARWQENGEWHQLWFEDVQSLKDKMQLAIDNKIKGFGFWAIGYDKAEQNLWAAINEKLNSSTNIADETDIPDEFVLRNNYPNPFNPSTNIVLVAPVEAEVFIHLYDELGRLVLTDETRVNPGENSIRIDFDKTYSSGTYFYRLDFVGNNDSHYKSLYGKFIFLK